MEATGTSWITLATTVVPADFAVSVINPLQAHNFATALLTRDKTDAVDAQTLAWPRGASRLAGARRRRSLPNSASAWRRATPSLTGAPRGVISFTP